MDQKNVITVEVRRSESGLFTATSDALEGVYVVHRDPIAIIADFPEIVRHWFKKHKQQDVVVTLGQFSRDDGNFAFPAFPIPAEIAAQALGR